jgi:hypothetical protein
MDEKMDTQRHRGGLPTCRRIGPLILKQRAQNERLLTRSASTIKSGDQVDSRHLGVPGAKRNRCELAVTR